MKYRNLRSKLIEGVSHLMLTVDDGAGDGGADGGGGAPAAAAEGDPPAELPAGDAGAAGGSEDPPEGGAAASEDGGEETPPPKSRTPWQVKRIDTLTAEKRAAEEARVAAEAQTADALARIAAYEALYGKQDGTPPAAAPAAEAGAGGDAPRVYTQAEVQAEAQRIASLQSLNDKCDVLFKDGTAKHGKDWTARIEAAGKAFGADLSNRVDFFQAITKLPNAVDVYHQLSGDLDHFAEVLSMGPVDLGMELASLSTKAATKPKAPAVSKVPAPIDPVGQGGGGAETKPENQTMSDYARGWKSPAERKAEREREMRGA